MKASEKFSLVVVLLVLFASQACEAQSVRPRESRHDERLAYARSLAEQGKIDKAVQQYQMYYADNPEKHLALLWISELYAANRHIAEAIEFEEKFLVSGDEYLTKGAHFEDHYNRLLRLWENAGCNEAARDHYLVMLEAAGAKPAEVIVARLMLGNVEDRAKNIAGAREHYLATLEMVSPAEGKFQKVANHVLLREFVQKRWLDDALTAYRNWPDYGYVTQLGEWLRREGRGFEMLELYEDYLISKRGEITEAARGPHWDGYHGRHGLAGRVIDELVSLGQGDSLIKELGVAIAEQPNNAELYKNLGHLFFKMKRYEEGLGELENYSAVLERPLVSDYQWIGGLCEGAGMINKAVDFYKKARDTEITDEEVHRDLMVSARYIPMEERKADFKARIIKSLGDLYLKQERWADAEECFKEIVDLDPRWGREEVQTTLATIWERMGKENAFVEDLKNEVAKDPCDVKLRVRYAETLSRAGKPKESIEEYEQAVELAPEDLSVRLKLAEALAKSKQNEKAIAEYKQVFYAACQKGKDEFRRGKGGDETEPWRVLHRLAGFCERAGEKDKLLEIYEEALKLMDSPDTKWKPEPYAKERILRNMVDILEEKREYGSIIDLCLAYRGELKDRARRFIQRCFRCVDSVKPFVAELQEETRAEPNDHWGRFILGDMLVAENREDKAVRVYKKLLTDVSVGSRIHQNLGYVFERMKQYDVAVETWKKELANTEKGSNAYGRWLGRIGDTYLRLGDREKAAESYRKAISCDSSEAGYQLGLFKATDGKEGISKLDTAVVKPAEAVEDLGTMRRRAALLLEHKKDYVESIKAYEQILERAPTDIESMVRLGEAYEKLGKANDAVGLYEKALRMRAWSRGSDYGAYGNLERIYRQRGEDKKLIGLFTTRGDYNGLKHFYRNRKEPEKYHEYLVSRSKQKPGEIKLRFYLGRSYLDRKEMSEAREIFEKLRLELVGDDGKVSDERNAIQLAEAFERLGDFKHGLEILLGSDYENAPARGGRVGPVLMRLYAKVGRFDKALEVCRIRLKQDPRGHQTVNIAEQITEVSRNCTRGPKLLDTFLEEVKADMQQHQYRRFSGAVKAYLAAHPAEQDSGDAGVDPVALLRYGRRVEVPKNCRSFAEFLEKLAVQADTVATQSFMGRYGQKRKPPGIQMENASAFEVLAAVLNGTNIPMEMTQDGHWGFCESGDKSRKICYGGSGGLICRFDGFNRRADRPHVWLLGRVMFEPVVKRHIASIQSLFMVLEAIDDRGRQVPIPKEEGRWGYSGQIEVLLGKQNPPARSVTKLRVKTAVVVCTKWVTFTVERLDHTEPIVLEKDGVKVQIKPIREVKWGRGSRWEIPIDVRRKDIELNAEGKLAVELKDQFCFVNKDGEKLQTHWGGFFSSGGHSEVKLRPEIGTFDPATTSLFIKEPAAIEIVPFELTFHNIPIIDR